MESKKEKERGREVQKEGVEEVVKKISIMKARQPLE